MRQDGADLRVIAGTLRGRRINAPPTDAVRPTYDRVRESVFGSIEPRLEGAAVLDLFAGSGSLGIESLSRGAASVTFVELDSRVMRVIERNIAELDLVGPARTVRGDALKLLEGRIPGGPFDVVFVDPPYSSGLAGRALRLLGARRSADVALACGALVVVERATGDDPGETVGRLRRTRTRRYGSTEVDFYETPADNPGREERT